MLEGTELSDGDAVLYRSFVVGCGVGGSDGAGVFVITTLYTGERRVSAFVAFMNEGFNRFSVSLKELVLVLFTKVVCTETNASEAVEYGVVCNTK